MEGGSNRDLRKYANSSSVIDAFSALVSGGKPGYKTIIEKKKVPPKCNGCGKVGSIDQKFCGECGGKMIVPLTNCPGCEAPIDDSDKFCINCGKNLKGI